MNMAETAVEFEARFENWVRWCRQRDGSGAGRVASLEGAYTGPQGKGHPTGWGDWEQGPLAPLPVKVIVDVNDALRVNRAYVQLAAQSPTNARIIQVRVFQGYLSEKRQAQVLGVQIGRLDELLDRAKKMLCNLLTQV